MFIVHLLYFNFKKKLNLREKLNLNLISPTLFKLLNWKKFYIIDLLNLLYVRIGIYLYKYM